MKLESINGLAVACGLTWFEIKDSPKEQKKRFGQIIKSTHATHTITAPGQESAVLFGTASTKSYKTVPGKIASALAWFGYTRPQDSGNEAIVWVFGYDAAKGGDLTKLRAWVGGINDGMPFKNCERTVPISEVSTTLLDLFPGDAIANTKVYVIGFPAHSFHLFGEHFERMLSLEETTAEALYDMPCPDVALLKQYGLSRMAMFGVVGVMTTMLVGAGLGGYYYYLLEQERERQAEIARQAQLAAMQPKPEEVFVQNFAHMFNTGEKRVSVAKGARQVFLMFGQTKMEENGWDFSSLTCSTRALPGVTIAPNVEVKPACQIEYRRTFDAGAIPQSVLAYPTFEKTVEGFKASKPVDFEYASINAQMKPADLFAKFQPITALDQLLDQLRVAHDFEMVQNYQPPTTVQPGPGQMPLPSIPLGEMKTGTWSVNGPFELRDVLMRMPETAYMHTLKIERQGKLITVKTDGYYFVAMPLPTPVVASPIMPTVPGSVPSVAGAPGAPVAVPVASPAQSAGGAIANAPAPAQAPVAAPAQAAASAPTQAAVTTQAQKASPALPATAPTAPPPLDGGNKAASGSSQKPMTLSEMPPLYGDKPSAKAPSK